MLRMSTKPTFDAAETRRKHLAQTCLYFAYGSNMDVEQMFYRCPTAQLCGNAQLDGWALKERLHADIEIDPESEVFGVLFKIEEEDLENLDIYEGYPSYYTRCIVPVKSLIDGKTYKAITYTMTPLCKHQRDPRPYGESYRELCHDAAEWHELPRNDYK